MALPTNIEVAKYLHLEGAEQDDIDLIDSLILVAVEDLADSGIKNKDTERYAMAIKLMVSNLFEERRPQVVGTITSKLNFSLERIILQLKAKELPSEGDPK